MDSCPKCKSTNFRKDGIVKSKQRYLCKDCKYRFTVEQIGKSNKVKRDALILYLEGLGFRSIGRFLNVSHVTVFNWIKSFGEKLNEFRNSGDIEVVELDEMHTYIDSKKITVGFGLLLIDMEKDLSISLLATGAPKQAEGYGKR
ncbi:MAG: Insertion element protein [Bacteroidetes bacterium GWA2_32_17]|nr:MAG: Insertion element protein [Bacteroidetes bacterium GWA2_32_17]